MPEKGRTFSKRKRTKKGVSISQITHPSHDFFLFCHVTRCFTITSKLLGAILKKSEGRRFGGNSPFMGTGFPLFGRSLPRLQVCHVSGSVCRSLSVNLLPSHILSSILSPFFFFLTPLSLVSLLSCLLAPLSSSLLSHSLMPFPLFISFLLFQLSHVWVFSTSTSPYPDTTGQYCSPLTARSPLSSFLSPKFPPHNHTPCTWARRSRLSLQCHGTN